jgi:hypothetical protein
LDFTFFSKKGENAFATNGFRNWKDAIRCFKKHEASQSHREAILKWTHYIKAPSITTQLSQQIKDEQKKAQTA